MPGRTTAAVCVCVHMIHLNDSACVCCAETSVPSLLTLRCRPLRYEVKNRHTTHTHANTRTERTLLRSFGREKSSRGLICIVLLIMPENAVHTNRDQECTPLESLIPTIRIFSRSPSTKEHNAIKHFTPEIPIWVPPA